MERVIKLEGSFIKTLTHGITRYNTLDTSGKILPQLYYLFCNNGIILFSHQFGDGMVV